MTDDRGHPAQSNAPTPDGWPKGVRPISQTGLRHLGVGDDGQLYWDNSPVQVGRKIDLTWPQIIFGILSLLVAAVGAGAAAISAYVDWESLHARPPAPNPPTKSR